jgi:hypothetical protein
MAGAEFAAAGDDIAVGLKPLIVLAHDDEIYILMHARQAAKGFRRADIGEEIEMLAQDRMGIDGLGMLGIGPMADRSQDPAVERLQRESVSSGMVVPSSSKARRPRGSSVQAMARPAASAAARMTLTVSGTIS